jgi:Fic family protein
MRRIDKYIHQLPGWPMFTWNQDILSRVLGSVRQAQGRILGRMEALGFKFREEATLQTLTLDILKSSEIEGEILDREQIRSSIAQRLGMEKGGLVKADRHVDGIVELMMDATRNYQDQLTDERLFGWHSSLFPSGRSGMNKIVTGGWRINKADDPMQVISGPMGKETVHFRAPDSELIDDEMKQFCRWFNDELTIDPVIKAGIAHLWFLTIHPFEDGNGRIARAIADMQLCRADGTSYRFYSMSAQIRKERNDYYEILERTQKGSLDITPWLDWFLHCLERALMATSETLQVVLRKARFWEENRPGSLNDRQVLLLNRLLDGFDGKLTTSKWAKIAKCSQDTALRDIQNLVERNILVKESSGGRSTSYALVVGE